MARRILFLPVHGSGLGHLTRLLACARRLPDDVEAMFLTQPSRMGLIRDLGFHCELLPRHPSWNRWRFDAVLRARVTWMIRNQGANAMVFDGLFPYRGLVRVREEVDVPLCWIRQGMWREKSYLDERALDLADSVDLVIEPGELAAELDRGLTVSRRHEAKQVDPIVLLDSSELLDRNRAREELGLDPSATAVLIALSKGKGPGQDVAAMTTVLIDRLLDAHEVEIVCIDGTVQERADELPEQVKRTSVYPLSRYFAAFDFAIGSAGYNFFHEAIAYGLPTIFVPMARQMEDQRPRSAYAERAGLGLSLKHFEPQEVDRCLQAMLDAARQSAIRERSRRAFPGNGALASAEAIASLASMGLVGRRSPAV